MKLNSKIKTVNLKLAMNFIPYRDITRANDAQIIRNSKVSKSSFVGQGSLVNVEVDRSPGAVEALCCRGIAVFVNRFNSSFERDFTSSCLISRKDDKTVRVDEGIVLEGRSWFTCSSFFWLSKSDIFRWIRFRVFEGFRLPKYGSSTFTQPVFFSWSRLSITANIQAAQTTPGDKLENSVWISSFCLTVCWLPYLLLAFV